MKRAFVNFFCQTSLSCLALLFCSFSLHVFAEDSQVVLPEAIPTSANEIIDSATNNTEVSTDVESSQTGSNNSLNPEYFPEYLADSLEDFQQKKYRDILADLKKYKKQKKPPPAFDKLFLLEGLIYKELNQFDNAKKALIESLKLRAANSDTLYLLAISEHHLGDSKSALGRMEEALWFNKHNIFPAELIKIKLAILYRELEMPEKASEVLKTIPASQNSDGLLMLADLQLTEGKKADAIATLKKLVSNQPDNPDAKIALANALLTETDRTFGKKAISEGTELISSVYLSDSSSYYIKHKAFPVYIRSLVENGELSKAESELKQALNKEPNNPEYQKLQSQLDIEKTAKSNLENKTNKLEDEFKTGGPLLLEGIENVQETH